MTITLAGISLSMRMFFTAAFFMPLAAQAAINKCVGADGKVVFSDQPCSTAQSATQLKAPAQAPAARHKPAAKAQMAAEGEAPGNSELNRYDVQCADDRRLLDVAQGRVKDTLSNQNFQLHKARVDQRCNPQMRIAAFDRDIEGAALSCRLRREELDSLKKMPERPPGYAPRAPEIASGQAWLEANCPAAGR